MTSRPLKAQGLLLLAFAVAFGVALQTPFNAAAQQAGAPAPEVAVVIVEPRPLPIYAELTGRTVAYRVAEVRPQVSGILLERRFEEGGVVTAGQPLYQIDPAIYDAAVQSAEAALAKAQAVLRTAQATADRYSKLVKTSAVSQQAYDDAIGELGQAKADVLVARAALDRARIDSEHTLVNAPIGGRVGKSHVTEGALVTANQAETLVTITQLNPIYVDVTQSAAELMALRQNVATGAVASDGKLPVQLTVGDWDSPYGLTGQLAFTDVTVDETTGTVLLRAVFPNPEEILLPGMFVRAKIQQGVRENAILVPQQALIRQADGSAAVWVVGDDDTVSPRPVTASRAIDDSWLITRGLSGGERVVTAGLQSLRPGAKVRVAGPEAAAAAPAKAG